MDDIDTSDLDIFLEDSSLIEYWSFKDFVSDVLEGDYLTDYNSVTSYIKNIVLVKIKDNLRFFVYLFICVVAYEVFKSFCENKYFDVKKSVKIIFCLMFAILILNLFRSYYNFISSFIDNVFRFSSILFPILIGLVTLSGSVSTASVYSSFSVFLLNTASYIIKYVLLPLSVAIFLLSLFGSMMKNKKFDRVSEIARLVFKYIVVLFFAIFGLVSVVNVVSSVSKDGINLKLTKYALKNYVPILGGYISEGFDFLHSCSILVKNAFGVCSIVVLFSMLVSPLVLSVVFIFCFKILSAVTGYIGDGVFSDMFNDVSKSFSNFLTVILGMFLIMFVFIFLLIVSVWVVWWF